MLQLLEPARQHNGEKNHLSCGSAMAQDDEGIVAFAPHSIDVATHKHLRSRWTIGLFRDLIGSNETGYRQESSQPWAQ